MQASKRTTDPASRLQLPLAPVYSDTARPAPDAGVLATIRFGDETGIDADGTVRVGLRPLDGSTPVEIWHSPLPVRTGRDGPIRYAENGEVLFGHLLADEAGDLQAATESAYRAVAAFLADSGYPHPFRIWNYMPDINRGDDEGLERYRAFCVGRHDALCAVPDLTGSLPAASAIGTRVPGLLISFIAAARPPEQIENPRQLSAFRYPREYGPRSPLFSRSVRVAWPGGEQLYVSGTASIVGHETRHVGDAAAQADETRRNLEALRERAAALSNEALKDAGGLLRVYVRREADLDAIRGRLEARLPGATPLLYLRGDICRAELLLEVEGVYHGPGA